MKEVKDTILPPSKEEITKLIGALGSEDGVERTHAREALIGMGRPVVPFLINALSDPRSQVRWEVGKALRYIKDPQTAPALVEALMDDSVEVRWLAAEGLIALKSLAIEPLLRGLAQNFGSARLRQGARHVLHVLQEHEPLEEPVLAVLEALSSVEPALSVPWAAKAALDALREKQTEPA